MTLGDLIRSYRDSHDLTMQEFADISGLSKGYISMLEKNKHPQNNKEIIPSIDTFNKVAKAMKITLNALLEAVNSNQLINLKEEHIDATDDLKAFDNIFPLSVKKFPLLGEIACGEPIFANEDRESYVLAGTDINADFCLKAKGDSMIGARILDGDIVFIKETTIVNNGEVAAVIVNDDEVLLKRFYYFPDENLLTLQSENPQYPPKNYKNEQLDHIKVLGKAVAFQSDII